MITDLSTACPDAWEWTIEPSTFTYVNGTDANSQNPELVFEDGVYSVTLKATNVNGESTATKTDYLYAGGHPFPYSEDFEPESLLLNDWKVVNPDDSTTWERLETAGNEPGIYSVVIKFHEKMTDNSADQLISPILDLSDATTAVLRFRHAYAQQEAGSSDSLNIYISDDCGLTWTKIFGIAEDGSGNFATAAASQEPFEPVSSDDWCGSGENANCISINISEWAGTEGFLVMFESIDKHGNALYLDDIEVTLETSASGGRQQKEVIVELYPIPASDYLSIDLRNVRDHVDVQLMNIQGTVLRSKRIVCEQSNVRSGMSLEGLSSGIYFIRINNSEFSKTERIIVK